MKNLLLLFVLLISSCSFNNNEELNKEVAKLKQENQVLTNNIEKNNLFEKKQECANYKKQIENIWTEKIKQLSILTWDWYKYEIWEIFYSTSLNTCIYTLEIYKYIGMVLDNKYYDYTSLNKFAYDYLNSKELISTVSWITDEEFYSNLEKLR